MTFLPRLLVASLLLVPFGSWVRAQPATLPQLAGALPAETALYITTGSIESLKEKIKQSPIYKLKDSPDFAPAMVELQQHWKEAREGIQKELGFDIDELLNSIRGEVALVVGSIQGLAEALGQSLSSLQGPEIKPEQIPLLLVLDTAGGKESFVKGWNALTEAARKHGVKVDEQPFRGGKLITVTRPEGETEGPENLYFAEIGTRFIGGMNKKFVEETLVNLESGKADGSLAQHPAFKSSAMRVGGTGDFFVYLNIKTITDAVDKALSGSMFAFYWQRFHEIFIGKTLNGLSSATYLEKGGLRSKYFVHNAGAADGVLGWLKTPPFPKTPSPLIPADATTYSTIGVNSEQIFKAIREVLQTVATLQAGGLDINAVFEQQFGIKLDDVGGSLGSRVHTFGTQAADPNNPFGDLCLILELKDDAPLKQLLERVSLMLQGNMQTNSYLDRIIYGFETGGPIAPGICATDKMFLASFQKANVEKVIRRVGKDEPGLAQSPGFTKASSFFPSQVASMSYADEKVWEDTMSRFAQMAEGSGEELPSWLFKALSGIGGSFGSMVSFGRWEDDGLYSEGWVPYRGN